MNKLFAIAIGGMLVAPAAYAQTVDVDANGNVRVDAGDGTRVEVGGNRSDEIKVRASARRGDATSGAQARPSTSVQGISSNSGNRKADGDSVQRVNIRGGRVNVATGGGTAISTISGRTTASTSADISGAGYVNEDLDGGNFSGRNLAGVAFTNASLNGASFANSILIGADFTNAELNRADLRGANLRNAQVVNAEFDGVKLEGATWIDGRVCGEGSVGGCR